MLRLHCTSMHAWPLELLVIEVEFNLFVYVHCMTFEMKMHNLVSWAITHWNARLVVREPRAISLWVTDMTRDVSVHTFAWIALPCKALPSAAVKQVLQEFSADRLHRVPTGHPSVADGFIFSRWPPNHSRWWSPLAGGIPQHPVRISWDFGSFQRSIVGKTEAACAWQWTSEQDRACIALGSFPEAVYRFLRLVDLRN